MSVTPTIRPGACLTPISRPFALWSAKAIGVFGSAPAACVQGWFVKQSDGFHPFPRKLRRSPDCPTSLLHQLHGGRLVRRKGQGTITVLAPEYESDSPFASLRFTLRWSKSITVGIGSTCVPIYGLVPIKINPFVLVLFNAALVSVLVPASYVPIPVSVSAPLLHAACPPKVTVMLNTFP